MTSQGRYAAPDALNRSGGNPASRGGPLVAVAVVVGLLLLWRGGIGDSGSADPVPDQSAAPDQDSSDAVDDSTGTVDSVSESDAGDSTATEDTTTSSVAVPTTRPVAEVRVAVANGVGEAGLAGSRSQVLGVLGYSTVAVDAASEGIETSIVYYIDGYEADAAGVAEALGATSDVIRTAPAELASLVNGPDAASKIADFHIVAVLGTDGKLG